MSDRFDGIKKVPKEPAIRLLALANMKLELELGTPANAPVAEVLAALDAHEERMDASIDMLRVMAAALPPRERTWWACLAGRDLLAPKEKTLPLPLAAAEAWVRKPSDDTLQAVRDALDAAEPDDDTTLAAVSAVFADGTLGPGDLKQYPAPPGASHGAAFGMNALALSVAGDGFVEAVQHLVDRALDLARGGNGKPDHLLTFKPEDVPEDDDEPEEDDELDEDDELEKESAS